MTPHSEHRGFWKERKRDVEYCLGQFDVTAGTRAGFRLTQLPENGERQSHRIRMALRRLGPVFVAFGIYLSSRIDLLPAIDCLELASLPDHAEPMTSVEVHELIGSQLHCVSEQAFLFLDLESCESRLMTQSHAGLLPDGSTVTVKLVRPDFQVHFEEELELLPLLKGLFTSSEWPELNLESEIAAFARAVRAQSDLLHEAESLEALALDAQEFDLLRVPALHRPLCTSAILTFGRTSGTQLVDMLNHLGHTEATTEYGIVRGLYLVWLRQALLGRAFPVEPRPENVSVFPNHQVAFNGGSFCSLPAEAKKNLVDYLTATLAEDPDEACSCLLKEVAPAPRNTGHQALRNSFRQAVTFGRGEWETGSGTHGLAERLFLHWRLLHQHGYQAQDHLVAFYRGLFLMTESCRQLTSTGDPLREAAEELRVIALLDQFREMPLISNWNANLGRYAALMVELPRKLDEVLTLAADGSPRLHLKVDEPPEPKRRQNIGNVMTGLCLLLVAIILLSPHFAPMRVLAADRIGVLVPLLMFILVWWSLK